MSIGSETNSGVSSVSVSDLVISGNASDGNGNGIRIKSDPSRGGLVTGMYVRRRLHQECGSAAVFRSDLWGDVGQFDTDLQDITIRNTHVLNLLGGANQFNGYDATTHALGLTLDNVYYDVVPTGGQLIAKNANITLGPGPVNFTQRNRSDSQHGGEQWRTTLRLLEQVREPGG